ncbi:MAG: 1,4-alpha-glucan branching protein [Fusobacteriales bacterium]|jgi:1,4-alpha-glucan branching enzyme|nr:1,4-alpha-glucan branching protein [Fusobacteriales bacterium]
MQLNKTNIILLQEEVERIVNASLADPFLFLGMHKLNEEQVVVRVFNPEAKKVKFYSDIEDRYLTKIDERGLFEEVFDSKKVFKYEIEYEYFSGNKFRTRDPYSFLPVLTDYDLYLFNEGNHHKIYEKLGAHVITHEGVKGTQFAVWAPEAQRVSVVGNFNNWDGRVHTMRILGATGVWEIFIPGVCENDIYKFEIKTKSGAITLKSDPYAFKTEKRPSTASIVYDIENKYEWKDEKWMNERPKINWLERPIAVYELHLGSWKRKNENEFLDYKDLAHQIMEYVKENNYTHIEVMPVAEHPLDESWGYQVTGYYSVTSRFGEPHEFMYFVDLMHQNGIGVIMDWVPGHFPKDAHGLGRFDGSALYEHEDPKQGEHMDWGTYIFNYGRNEVKNFLISNALFWMDKYHIDGLRVDAVASMLYLDYSRKDGEWVPNRFGGRENLEAIEFLKYFNSITHQYHPGILTIAEESTSFPAVTKPTYLGGLGFSLKWNMGWMNDSLEYISKDPIYRKYHQGDLTFSLIYAFSENFKLVISHDEVVHGKGSLINKMPGDDWQKFANMRLFYAYAYAHPGKKLFFMGCEFGQWNEWNCNQSIDWHLLQYEPHKKLLEFVKTLNKVYKENKALWEIDFSYEGFEWIDFNDSDNSIISFIRKSKDGEKILCAFNFTPAVQNDYRIGVPESGYYEEILNSDSEIFYGSNVGNLGGVYSEPIPIHGRNDSIKINIPPLAGVYFKLKK